jgi:ribosomal protein S18 acetylase RimI-like enzyme
MEILPWDSEFFGARIARGSVADLEEARRRGVDCLYVVVGARDFGALKRVVLGGGILVALRAELGARLVGRRRRATRRPLEVANMHGLARQLASSSRFMADPHFDRAKVGEMYEVWVDRCFEEGSVVASPDGLAAGRAVDGEAQVELVYVKPSARRRGLAKRLVSDLLLDLDADRAVVATEAANARALRLYRRLGFRLRKVDAIAHVWLN